MDLQLFVSIAQIVSALAVLFTLLGLIVSIRQNTKSQKALAVDSLAAAITSINVPAMQNPALGSALAKASANWGSASRDERILAHFFFVFFLQVAGERVVSAEVKNPRSGTVARMGNSTSKILP
jgi:hypothetical protein